MDGGGIGRHGQAGKETRSLGRPSKFARQAPSQSQRPRSHGIIGAIPTNFRPRLIFIAGLKSSTAQLTLYAPTNLSRDCVGSFDCRPDHFLVLAAPFLQARSIVRQVTPYLLLFFSTTAHPPTQLLEAQALSNVVGQHPPRCCAYAAGLQIL